MLLTNRSYKRILLLCVSGVLTGLTVVFPQIGVLGYLTLIPFALFLLDAMSDENYKLRSLYGYGSLFFMSFCLVNFHWFINLYPLDFIDGMTPSGAILIVLCGTVGISLLHSITGAIIFPLLGLLARSRVGRKIHFLHPLMIAAAWTILEWTYPDLVTFRIIFHKLSYSSCKLLYSLRCHMGAHTQAGGKENSDSSFSYSLPLGYYFSIWCGTLYIYSRQR